MTSALAVPNCELATGVNKSSRAILSSIHDGSVQSTSGATTITVWEVEVAIIVVFTAILSLRRNQKPNLEINLRLAEQRSRIGICPKLGNDRSNPREPSFDSTAS